MIYVFKTYHKLQGSQTQHAQTFDTDMFKTYHKLQGSQTRGNIMAGHSGLRHIINYKVLKQSNIKTFVLFV